MTVCPTCRGTGRLGVAGAYVFPRGRGVEHLVDDADADRSACGLELAGAQLVLAGGRLCRWCLLVAGGRVETLEAAAA